MQSSVDPDQTRRLIWVYAVCQYPFNGTPGTNGIISMNIFNCSEKSDLHFSYVCSICACLDLSVSSSSWNLGRAAVCDYGTPLTFLLPFIANTLLS